ncbi:MAG: hypothetical protein A3C47_00380 [Omnitrophica bacterium RIFCSPHIGHO2_02_FULL_51_18]|nr:MAG: hypothetical protein A3C47_00380 [Omnitrophica bacterium RIFCSPHIGHO2_02_FULL_51_18]
MYKKGIEHLEEPLRNWEEDFSATKYVAVSVAAEKCYVSFNDLQIGIVSLKDDEQRKKHHLLCYKSTYDFLAFVENDVDTDFCLDVLRESEPFRRLFSHYSKYCADVERKYDIETESEKALKSNPEFLRLIQEYTV